MPPRGMPDPASSENRNNAGKPRRDWVRAKTKRAALSAALGVTLIDKATKLTCHGAALIFRLHNGNVKIYRSNRRVSLFFPPILGPSGRDGDRTRDCTVTGSCGPNYTTRPH